MPQPPDIDLNPEFRRALHFMEDTDKSVFVTGRAGTGKSTLLTYFRRNTKKKVAALAPTGVAALNIKGQTIHSFFRFKPSITLEQVKKARFRGSGETVYKKLDTIVIDEISMVRADLLDCVDRFLRLNGPKADLPFGGIQMVFIGDLYQLPPVVTGLEKAALESLYQTPYFYGASVFRSFDMEFIELEKVYRQHDEEFISLLNSIRNDSVTDAGLALLNRRCMPDFEPAPGSFYIYLTTTNDLASRINGQRLAGLRTDLRTFAGETTGDFGGQYLPTAVELLVKVGAQVMMLSNDAAGRWVNGTIGTITAIRRGDEGENVIAVDLADGDSVDVAPYTWELFRFTVEEGSLQAQVVGSFRQYPLMLAWAVTIHKSQGKTFDRVIIDMGRGAFTPGQTYLALSRCTTLDGIVLKRPLEKKHIWTDYKVVDFLTKYQYRKAQESCPVDHRVEMIREAIRDKALLQITYLKPNDEKSTRTVRPEAIEEMEYAGKAYLGMRAFCYKRKEDRTFLVDRILEIRKP